MPDRYRIPVAMVICLPWDQLIRDSTPGAYPITSIGELRNGAFENSTRNLTRSWAFVLEGRGTRTFFWPPAEAVVLDTDVASRSFRERLPQPPAARLVGNPPILTFVTVGELAQWTKLRHWGPACTLAMLDSWLADKPVIPGSKAIAADLGVDLQRGAGGVAASSGVLVRAHSNPSSHPSGRTISQLPPRYHPANGGYAVRFDRT